MKYVAELRSERKDREPFLFISSSGEPCVNAACGSWRRATQLDLVLYTRAAHQPGSVRQEG